MLGLLSPSFSNQIVDPFSSAVKQSQSAAEQLNTDNKSKNNVADHLHKL
jgi:hypothetical protein